MKNKSTQRKSFADFQKLKNTKTVSANLKFVHIAPKCVHSAKLLVHTAPKTG